MSGKGRESVKISRRSATPAAALAPVVAVVTGTTLPVFLTGALGVQVRADLGLGEAGLGLAVGGFFGTAALASAVLGRWAERVGAIAGMRLSGAGSAAVMVAVAAGARGLGALVAILAVGGLANALSQPAANLFIARTVPARRLGLAFAVKQSGIPAATLLGGLAVPAFALTVGWRWAFVAAAAVPLAGVAVLSRPGRGGAGAPPAAPPSAAPGAAPGAGADAEAGTDAAPFAAPVPRPPLRPLAVLALGIGLGAAAAGTLGAFLANAAVAAGVGEGAAGLLVSAGSAFGIAVRLAAGTLADRRPHGHLGTVAAMLATGAVGYLLYATEVPLLLVLGTPLAFGAGWGWPGLFNFAVVRHHPEAAGTASGITQTGTYAGAVAGPVLFGLVVERVSYPAAWAAAAGLALAGAAAMLAGQRLIQHRPDADSLEEAATPADPL